MIHPAALHAFVDELAKIAAVPGSVATTAAKGSRAVSGAVSVKPKLPTAAPPPPKPPAPGAIKPSSTVPSGVASTGMAQFAPKFNPVPAS